MQRQGCSGRIQLVDHAELDDRVQLVDHADVLNPILREKGIKSLLGAPLLVSDSVLGVIHVGTLSRLRIREQMEAIVAVIAPDQRALVVIDVSRFTIRASGRTRSSSVRASPQM